MDMGIGDSECDPFPEKLLNIKQGLGRRYQDFVKRLYGASQASLWEDAVSIDGKIDNLCFEIAQELYAMANDFNVEVEYVIHPHYAITF